MCGVVGIVTNKTNIDGDILATLHHRGPDSNGSQSLFIANQTVWLGHTRLAILDLTAAGHQPMQSSNGHWWLTFNGEIYNHLELRKNLNHSFRGHSDTETLIELIAQYGIEKTLPQLNGMFAFAALDTQTNKLYLVRDPFGIKPLYYFHQPEHFAFASEARALKKILPQSVNFNALNTFLTLRYIPSPETLWQDIKRLPAGHILSVDIASHQIAIECYIKPTKTVFQGTLTDAIDAYHNQLQTAIQRQLLSDVPVGILLSGGIDSALVAAMAKNSHHELNSFTVGFQGQHIESEIEDAQETASLLGLNHTPIIIDENNLQTALFDIVNSVEEPLGTTSIMPMWFLARGAKEKVTVVLTGQGSDEPWGGYRRYQIELIRQLFSCPTLFRCMANKLPTRYLPEAIERGLRTMGAVTLHDRFIEAYSLFNTQERLLLTGKNEIHNATKEISYWLDWLSDLSLTATEKMMRIDTRLNLADDLLLYGDKISMSIALETRVPMLDLELVEFIESLPLSYRVSLNKTKIVHKLMAEKYLPKQIVHRPKKGFQVPFGYYSRHSWKTWIEEILFDNNAPHWQVLNKPVLWQFWQEHLHKKPDRSRQFFALLMLAIWWKQQ